MKIYDKKKFGSGLVCMALSLLNLIASFWTGFDVSGIILILALLLFGVVLITRSLSYNLSREDKLEELDERNQLIELKTKSKSFRLTQGICFGLMLVFLVMGKVSGENLFIGMGVGLAFAYAVSMFTEIFTCFYYDNHM